VCLQVCCRSSSSAVSWLERHRPAGSRTGSSSSRLVLTTISYQSPYVVHRSTTATLFPSHTSEVAGIITLKPICFYLKGVICFSLTSALSVVLHQCWKQDQNASTGSRPKEYRLILDRYCYKIKVSDRISALCWP